MGHTKSSPQREVHSTTGLHQEARKISDKQSNPTPKRTKKQQQTKPRGNMRKEMIKIRVEINDIEPKKK